MDAKSPQGGKRRYITPRWVQAWFLGRSRDNWKAEYKQQLEKQHSRGGFTQLLLGFGAMPADVTGELVLDAMRSSRTLDVRRWAADKLGVTLFARRKRAFAGATKVG